MNDEGIGIAGWLLADLTLVLALIFLALVPGRAASPPSVVEPPVITDIGCRHTAEAMPVVTCQSRVEGEGLSYRWEVSERGAPEGALDAATLRAAFAGAGWVRLVASNEGGETDETYPVIPPTPTPEPTPEPGLPQADFSFDQLVLSGIGGDHSTDALELAIADAEVRPGLSKSAESERDPETEDGVAGEEWLRQKQERCLRIALVETFSRSGGGDNRFGAGVGLSEAVNEALFSYLGKNENSALPNRSIFYDPQPWDATIGLSDVRDKKTAAYYDSFDDRHGDPESRINLFFVKDQTCDPSP